MKIIETKYNGVRFRSRTEARWAVFMDAIQVPYEYEKEAYDLDGFFYLPDFWLPSMDAHLEIKGEHPTEKETEKARRLSQFTKKNTYIIFGQPKIPEFGEKTDSAHVLFYTESLIGWDSHYLWCECQICGKCELQFDGRADRINCHCKKSKHGDKGYNFDSDKLVMAYEKARSYRFESSTNK